MTEEPSPELATHRHDLLRRLAANDRDPALAEMARELLAGRTTPAGVLTSGIYDEALAPGVQAFTSWYTSASEQERQAAAQQGEKVLADLADDAPVTRPRRPPRPRGGEDDDFSDRTYLR